MFGDDARSRFEAPEVRIRRLAIDALSDGSEWPNRVGVHDLHVLLVHRHRHEHLEFRITLVVHAIDVV